MEWLPNPLKSIKGKNAIATFKIFKAYFDRYALPINMTPKEELIRAIEQSPD